ncbi:MAG TPA: type 4a pilus biogenesis protein PilO [Acidimicrobiia bacterium]|nr:type 4a pilus biogenesis protein PilO [Acidimicrobiia bacterium]
MQVKTKNLVVGALVVSLVGLLWYRVVYSSMESKASKATSAAHDADVTSANLRKELSGVVAQKPKKGQEISAELLRGALPTDAAEASFLRGIDTIRVKSGADWQSVTPTAPVAGIGITTVNVSITAQGTEDQLKRYIAGIYGLQRVFIIDNVSFSGSGSSAPAGSAATPRGVAGQTFIGDKLQLTIAGRIFSQPTAAPTGTSVTGTGTAGRTPTTGAPAPTGAAGQTGVQNG